MEARMKNPVYVLPEAMKALQALQAVVESSGLPAKTLGLVHLRTSQINGCSVCVDLHLKLMRGGETEQRLLLVSAWREAPYYSDAERAALQLAESVTRLADRADAVPDAVWAEAAKHYDEKQLSGLLLEIGSANVWNRLNCATRQVAGKAWQP